MEYEKMLDRLYLLLPKEALTKERFEMPKAESHIQGNKTFVNNFAQILKTINRTEDHLFKYITKEIATAAFISKGKLALSGKFSSVQVNEIFENYIKQYVLCHECNRPDTKFFDQHGIRMLKCHACGAMSPIKKL